MQPSDAIWLHDSWSTQVQVMVSCLRTWSNNLHQCWRIINSDYQEHISMKYYIRNTKILFKRCISPCSLWRAAILLRSTTLYIWHKFELPYMEEASATWWCHDMEKLSALTMDSSDKGLIVCQYAVVFCQPEQAVELNKQSSFRLSECHGTHVTSIRRRFYTDLFIWVSRYVMRMLSWSMLQITVGISHMHAADVVKRIFIL